MWRPMVGSLIGMLVGIGMTVLIVWLTFGVIARMTAPQVYEIEYRTIYLLLILGAGFGALCGTLTGFASAVLREWRKSSRNTGE